MNESRGHDDERAAQALAASATAPPQADALAEALRDPTVSAQLERISRMAGHALHVWSNDGRLLFTTGDEAGSPPAVEERTDVVASDGSAAGHVSCDASPDTSASARDLLGAARQACETWIRTEDEKNVLAEEILVRLRELNVLHDVAGALARAEGASEVGRDVLVHAAELVAPSWGFFVAHDAERSAARVAALIGADWSGIERGWRPMESGSLLWQAMRDAEPLVLPRLAEPERRSLVRDLGHVLEAAASLLIVPTCVAGEPLGAVVLVNGEGRPSFTTVEAKLVSAMASQAAVSLRHLRLYEESQEMFFSTVWSLASAIDAKDAYTHGHGQRVARYASALAREIGFDDEEVERLELSAVLHDVGKIGVPEAILNKPGRLTAAEMAVMRTHPEKGADILSSIRSMRDIVPGVRHHHERWDGGGYPNGLKTENIPFTARLILVADTFDAMTSTRPYRAGLPVEVALDELHRCSGTQFEPRLAEVFCRIVERGDVRVVDEAPPRRAPQHCGDVG